MTADTTAVGVVTSGRKLQWGHDREAHELPTGGTLAEADTLDGAVDPGETWTNEFPDTDGETIAGDASRDESA